MDGHASPRWAERISGKAAKTNKEAWLSIEADQRKGYSNVNVSQKLRSVSQSASVSESLFQRFPKKRLEKVDRFDPIPGLLCTCGKRLAFGLSAPPWTRRREDGDFLGLLATRLGIGSHVAGLGCHCSGGVSPGIEP